MGGGGLRKVKDFQKRATHAHPNFQGVPRVQTMGAFRYVRPTGQRPVELTKWIWHDIVRKKQNFQPYRSVSFTFRPNFDYSLVKWDWKREFLKMNGKSDWTDRSKRTTSGGGPLFPENFHLDRSVPFMF